MSKSVAMALEMDGIKYNDTRPQPLITWLQFMNFITVAIISLFFIKVYNGIYFVYEWIFPFKTNQMRHPLVLMVGPNSELNQKIVAQLSETLQAKVVQLPDLSESSVSKAASDRVEKQSQIIVSHVAIKSQDSVVELSDCIRKVFGDVDMLLVSQSEEPVPDGTSCSFLNQLNTHLLTQFWIVMAFLPGMVQRNSGHIVSIALSRTSSLTNTGIMRSMYEEIQQSDTKVKLTLIERNGWLENHLPGLPDDVLARLIIRSIWSSKSCSMVAVPSCSYYLLLLPIFLARLILHPVWKVINSSFNRQEVFK